MNLDNMIFIKKENMTSVFEKVNLSNFSGEAYQHFMSCEDEVLYILDEEKVLGVFSVGDLERYYREGRQQLEINCQYTSLKTIDYHAAEEFFKRAKTINEVPVVTNEKRLKGIIKREKGEALRNRQRDALREARFSEKRMQWSQNEIRRFINTTRAKVMLYTYSDEEIKRHYDKDTVETMNKRHKNSNDSEWKGLSDTEWKTFWGSEYEEGLVAKMRSEMEHCNLSIKNGVGVFPDTEGECYSYRNGHRITPNNPLEADRRIFMFGPCIVIGGYCKDDQTIAYYLQDSLIREGYTEYKVINKGLFGPEYCYAQMFLEELSENDIVIIWCLSGWLPDKIEDNVLGYEDVTEVFLKIPLLVNNIVDAPMHCNYIVNQKLAESMFNDICSKNILKNIGYPEMAVRIQNYYINWEVREYFIEYFEKYGLCKKNENIRTGACVMNCNPFTKGHRYLIEQALSQVDELYIFVVEEDKSFFKFQDRLKMVQLGISDLFNVHVIPSGDYILSQNTFSQYFEKEQVQIVENMDYDLYVFGEIVAANLGVKYRFVGEEPFDKVTKQYNETMKRILPNFGVEVIEIPRKTFNSSGIISASLVRKAIQEKDWTILEKLCPQSTILYLREILGRKRK